VKHEAQPLFGDLSSVVGEGNRIRCPRCQKLRAYLLLVRSHGTTTHMCPTCERTRPSGILHIKQGGIEATSPTRHASTTAHAQVGVSQPSPSVAAI
jgi:hypothetical protein